MASALRKVWRLPSDGGSLVFDERESLLMQVLDSGRAYRKSLILLSHSNLLNSLLRENVLCSHGDPAGCQYARTSRMLVNGASIRDIVLNTETACPAAMRADDSSKNPGLPEENVGTSLFHRLWAQRMVMPSQEEMKFLLHRLVVASGISASLADRMELGAHWETLCHRVQRRHHGDVVTGLLLLYPTCTLHIVECSSEALVTILQDLGGVHTPEHSPPTTDARVLAVSHDLPARLFLQWSCKTLTPGVRPLAGGSERETTEKLVTDVLERLVRLGQHMPKGSKVAMDAALEQVPELMVPQGVVEELLRREELLTPQRYLEVYHSPLNAMGDSGHIFSSNLPTTV